MSAHGIGSSSNQPLPSKELGLFKKILKCYEQRQYKVGLRCAKQILSNPTYAEHGETLAMKGLILNCIGKHDEALEVVKKGLTSDIKSHICWHVFGLVQRSDKKYDEAMKAYKMALRIETDNLQILRDLSLLQIQMRDYEGYRDSRYRLLVLRPTHKLNWIAYANAHHLLKEYDMALSVIKEFNKNNRPTSQYDIENSELILYEIMILYEAGNFETALIRLEENSVCITDRLKYLETRALLLMELRRIEEAEKVYWLLVERNSENFYYYKQIERCRSLEISHRNLGLNLEELLDLYDTIIKRYPRSNVPKIMQLSYAEGDDFELKIYVYLITSLRKGIPSLFKNLLIMYKDAWRRSVIEKILLGFVKSVEDNGYNKLSLDGSSQLESPTTSLWIYYYLAQHFDRLGNYQRAHKYIDEAINHTPTLIELHMTKAKIYKHENEFENAADIMNQAQELDTADRYINSKCAKYFLRAGRMSQAEEMCAKFTRENVNASESLNEMQCIWYELHCAEAFYATGCFGEALKKCHQVERHFVNFYEDQYDFHSYCLRKLTLTSYMKILRFEEEIKGHHYYLRAVKLAAKIYLEIFETPEKFEEKEHENDKSMSEAEQRKMRRKANKEKAIQREKQNGPTKNAGQKRRLNGELDVVEAPFDAEKLLKTDNPLNEALKFIQPVLYLPCKDVDVFCVAFKIYYHKNKVLAMLRCLNRIHHLDPSNPNLKGLHALYLEKYKSLSLSNTLIDLTKDLNDDLYMKIKISAL